MPTPPCEESPTDETYRLEKLMPAFNLAFGQFIRQFGQTESTLAHSLELFAGRLVGETNLNRSVLRALLGSKRTPELATATKLCVKAALKWEFKPTPDALEVDQLYAQLSEVRFLRDRTAHYAIGQNWTQGPVYFRVLNRYTVNDTDKTEEILFQIEHLEKATTDLQTICTRISFALGMSRRGENYQDPSNPVIRPPWLYKPSELIRTPYPET
jgi:virulence-associated protein VapD